MNELHKRGHKGVGSDLAPAYSGIVDGSAVTTMPYASLDITDKSAVERVISEIRPEAVIHCAGWTAVDAAEDEDKKALVHRINVDGTQYIADACKAEGCKMLYLSTDYVFDGKGEMPWQSLMSRRLSKVRQHGQCIKQVIVGINAIGLCRFYQRIHNSAGFRSAGFRSLDRVAEQPVLPPQREGTDAQMFGFESENSRKRIGSQKKRMPYSAKSKC